MTTFALPMTLSGSGNYNAPISGSGAVYPSGGSAGAAGYTIGVAGGNASATTIYPCGHSAAYFGTPHAKCPYCGTPHQWAGVQGMAQPMVDYGVQHPAAGAVGAMGSPGAITPYPAPIQVPEPKVPTVLDWLDEQISGICEIAFA